MGRYVIGDIHGCLGELSRLIEALPLARKDLVVFLGDYIDRGPDSQAVVSYLLSLKAAYDGVEFVFLKGNHEDMFLSYLDLGGQHGDMFLPNGGKTTLTSYGLVPENTNPVDVLAALPPDHLEFFQSLSSYHITDPYLCVHAGIRPDRPLAEQQEEDLLWIRNPFIYRSHQLPYTVLFGHTPQPTVLYDLPYKIGLDTGLVWGNMLTCLEVDEKVLFQIGRGKKSVTRTSAERRWKPSTAFTA